MKNKLSCFYDVKNDKELKEIWENKDTIFIFDTNVLLSLYSFKTDSRKDFFMILSKIKPQLWIPFHVALEFQLNRVLIIKNRRKYINDLIKEVETLNNIISFEKKTFSSLQNKFSLQKNYPEIYSSLNEIQLDITEKYKEIESNLKEKVNDLKIEINKIDTDKLFINSTDFIREEIDLYFNEDRVGKNTFDTKEKLDELNKDGTYRYENLIPPGYEDAKAKGEETFSFDGLCIKRKFGDLMIFKQIIEHAKEKKSKNIIFISEDVKEDWRHIEEFEGKKILGARIELKREIYKKADVSNFLIFNIEDFMKKTDEYLDVKIQDDTISNIKESLAKEASLFKKQLYLEQQKRKKIIENEKESISNDIKNNLFSKMFIKHKNSDWSIKTDNEDINDPKENIYYKTELNNKDRAGKLPNFDYNEESDDTLNINTVYTVDENLIYRATSCIRKLTKFMHMNFPKAIIDELRIYRKNVNSALKDYEYETSQINLNMLELTYERANNYLSSIENFLR
ncbi:TPA: PIN-like domain-containing protein [Providencia rettgeri]